MKKELIVIRFSSAERFIRFRTEIQSGRIFLPTPDPLPPGSRVLLKLIIPSNREVFLIDGGVSEGGGDPGRSEGMSVLINKDLKAVLSGLDKAVAGRRPAPEPPPRRLPEDKIPPAAPGLPPEPEASVPAGPRDDSKKAHHADAMVEKSGKVFSFESLKDIVSRDETLLKQEEEETPDETPSEERKLTPEERQRAEPVARFIMNLTKAISRSGYYNPDHPGSKDAKQGLLDEFLSVAGDCSEMAFSIKRTREDVDIMIAGILDDQVSVRSLVGSKISELFMPKLDEYFERKGLLSFAVKRNITPEHFDRFIDIMSDPLLDQKEVENKGGYLTNALIEGGITEISTVFSDDMVALETDLPWRVEMAINRLAKDLKIMPMFKGFSTEALKKLKLQAVKDIIRPLKHPRYLNDFLVNCYLIAKHVEGMEAKEIERIIVDAFPIEQLLPTSRFIFKELEHLKHLKEEHPDSKEIVRRHRGIKRILKLISSRVLLEKAPGAHQFLEQLYQNEILSFEELPADVRHIINTGRMADDIKSSFQDYAARVLSIKSSEEALVYLKCFRRAVPLFVEQGDWEILREISSLVEEASGLASVASIEVMDAVKTQLVAEIKDSEYLLKAGSNDVATYLIAFVFIPVIGELVSVFGSTDQARRGEFEKFIDGLGVFSVDVMARVLTESGDREARKRAFESLATRGEPARKWALKVLDDKKCPWYVHRNAMMILRQTSRKQIDFEKVRGFLRHSEARLRDEALNVAAALRPLDFEELIIRALFDEDAKVRWRAVKLIGEISPVSEDAMRFIFKMLVTPLPEDKKEAAEHMKRLTALVSAINVMPRISDTVTVETEVLRALKGIVGRDRGLVKLLKWVAGSEEESGVLKIAIPLLGRIGGAPSANFLKKLNRSHPRHSELIKDALCRIKQRQEKR